MKKKIYFKKEEKRIINDELRAIVTFVSLQIR